MKRSQLTFTILMIPVDYIMLLIAAALAYRFRAIEIVTEVRPIIYNLDFESYISYAAGAAAAWLVIFALTGLYIIKSNRKLSEELGRIFIGCSIGLLAIVFAIFLQRELFSSRFIILVAWIFAMIFIFIGRAVVLYIQRRFLERGLGAIKVVLIGNGATTEALIAEMNKNLAHGFKIIKTFPNFNDQVKAEILELNKQYHLDEIIVSDPNMNKETMLAIVDFADENHLGFRYAADMFNALATNIKVEPIAGIPVVEIKRTPLDGWGRIFKRTFDIIVSLALLIILSPIFLIVAIAVKLDSKGPVFFINERVGQNGNKFDTYKFRSMKIELSVGKQNENIEEALEFERQLIKEKDTRKGPVYKIEDDPRITRVGRFIRKWSIDELPQIYNVLKGKMSMVGPRPHQPREVEKYEKHHLKLLTIKPGITGLAQVSGRSDLNFDDEAKLDIYYIETWSPLMDLQIMLKTPRAVVRIRKTV